MVWDMFAVLGLLLVGRYALDFLIEVLRCFYWAVWEAIPVYLSKRDQPLSLFFAKQVYHGFRSNFTDTFRYEEKSCKYYAHGYWPWDKPREWRAPQ